jgi:hypothetical protein
MSVNLWGIIMQIKALGNKIVFRRNEDQGSGSFKEVDLFFSIAEIEMLLSKEGQASLRIALSEAMVNARDDRERRMAYHEAELRRLKGLS